AFILSQPNSLKETCIMAFTHWRLPFLQSPLPRRRHLRVRAGRRRPAVPVKLSLEQFEDRTLPSIDVTQAFAGLAFDPRVPADLPDTILAVGPNKVVEATNRDVAFYDKITEAGTPETPLPLKTFFAPVLPGGVPVGGDIITDPKVAYDQAAGRFVLTTLE